MRRNATRLAIAVALCAAVGGAMLMNMVMSQPEFTLAPEIVWNDFDTGGLPPDTPEVQAYRAVPLAEEKERCAECLEALLSRQVYTSDLPEHLVGLKGWGGHNVFLVRQRRGEWVVQISERAGQTELTVARADGVPIAEGMEALARLAHPIAQAVLAPGLLPPKFPGLGLSGRSLGWTLATPVILAPHTEAWGVHVALSERKVVLRVVERAREMGPRGFPPPYTFGADSPYVLGERTARPTTYEERVRRMEEEKRRALERARQPGAAVARPAGPVKTELTPEEMAKQAN